MLPNLSDIALYRDKLLPLLAAPSALPLSFSIDKADFHGLKNAKVKRERIDSNITKITYRTHIGEMSLRVECITYSDFPVIEWTAYVKNHGDQDSAIVADLFALDTVFVGENPIVHLNNGDFYSSDGYTPQEHALSVGESVATAPVGGRPCDRAFPYQRVMFDSWGINIAIGWPGSWRAEYTRTADGIAVKAGQESLSTLLHPGETLRTPRMTLMAFDGEIMRGVNLWRAFMNAHVTPKRNGRLMPPLYAASENAGGIEFTLANQENQIAAINYLREKRITPTHWWIDAGWYPCIESDGQPHWPKTGSWFPDPQRFPNGLKPIADACKDAGMELLVWFEPERVRPDTWLFEHKRSWLLEMRDYGETPLEQRNYLLNLADKECREWLTDTISRFLIDSGIGCYRQDFNFEPLPFWRDNEAPDRLGMLENQYVEGYLAYFDALLDRVPGLMIDSCSSGGRRNDIETMRRAVPLHPTDYGYGYHHINQAFRHTLFSWIPYTRGFTGSWDKDNEYYPHEDYYAPDVPEFDSYKLINGFAPASILGLVSDIKKCEEQIPRIRSMCALWRDFSRDVLTGDFYPLTPNHRDFTRFTVYQFAFDDHGAIQSLRNNACMDESITVFPRAVCAEKTYVFTNAETGQSLNKSGAELIAEGLTLAQPKRSGAIWLYKEA